MSIHWMTWAWGLDISQGQKMVLLALADRANDDGECWPGQESLAAKCSMTERAVRDNIRKLEEVGLIETERRESTNHQRKTNLYRLIRDQKPPEVSSGGSAGARGSLRQKPPEDISGTYKEETSVRTTSVLVTDVTKTDSVASEKIEFDADDGIFVNITPLHWKRWELAFPKIDVDAELARAEVWYMANSQRRKRNHERFIVNWLSVAALRIEQVLKRPPSAKANQAGRR